MRLARIVRAGIVLALAVAAGGWALERARFGRSDELALARVEAELRQRFDASADMLGALATGIAPQADIILAATRDASAAKQLFETVDAALPGEEAGRTGITVYDPAGVPLAWSGRISELPKARVDGPAALFVAPGALGPRLVRVEPVVDRTIPPPHGSPPSSSSSRSAARTPRPASRTLSLSRPRWRRSRSAPALMDRRRRRVPSRS